jgi:hypothetical protein
MKTTILILISLSLFGCSEPNTFDDCILENMKGVQSDDAARMIYDSCYDKYNKKPSPEAQE